MLPIECKDLDSLFEKFKFFKPGSVPKIGYGANFRSLSEL
jgi:hypothetical protein